MQIKTIFRFRVCRRRLVKNAQRNIRKFFLFFLAVFFLLPAVLVLSGTILSRWELEQCLASLTSGAGEYITWKFLPRYPDFEHYARVLFYTPQFFVVFWNSMKIAVLVLLGQLLLAVPAAWAFAVYRFRFRKILFTLYVVLMLMPFQVTMLSSYLVLDGLHLINTHGAVIIRQYSPPFRYFLFTGGFAPCRRASSMRPVWTAQESGRSSGRLASLWPRTASCQQWYWASWNTGILWSSLWHFWRTKACGPCPSTCRKSVSTRQAIPS